MRVSLMARADIIEIVVSGFKPGLTHQKEIELSKSINDFIKKRPGFKSRTLFYDEKQKLYVDMIAWKDLASAQAAAKEAEGNPICQSVFAQIEQKGIIFLHANKVLEFGMPQVMQSKQKRSKVVRETE